MGRGASSELSDEDIRGMIEEAEAFARAHPDAFRSRRERIEPTYKCLALPGFCYSPSLFVYSELKIPNGRVVSFLERFIREIPGN
jgi:hypothetical protein